jgi:hypothetical protein
MVINCSQCEFRPVACGNCLVTVLAEDKETMDTQDVTGVNHALGAQELRALGVLATAGLVPPLRYRPAQLSNLVGAIVAL